MKSREYLLMAPCHFGLESVLKKEIYDLGYEIEEVEDGRVSFKADAEGIALANIHLRTAERVLICCGRFKATTWEEFFQGIKAIDWESFIPADGRFWVTKATSVKSTLFSTADMQRIAKRAMVERMRSVYETEIFPETGADFPVRVTFMKDEAVVTIDTTGVSLHKRGYRTLTGKAPISETMAAALIMLTPWHADRILVDPFCGSGTFLIEAAMMAADIAPGLDRSFTSETWDILPQETWNEIRAEARSRIKTDVQVNLQGYDIDPEAVKIARANAVHAGVDHMIHFQTRAVADLNHSKKYGFIITNPPYGERLEDRKDLPDLYRQIGESYRRLDSWSMYLITSYEDAERYIGRKADKNRKLYNGMIKTYFYQYMGPKPPRRQEQRPVDAGAAKRGTERERKNR